MPNKVIGLFGSSTALTVTLASLANNSARQSTIVDNTTTRHEKVVVYVKLTVGTSPTADSNINVYLIRDDADATTPHRTDGAGASDAAITIKNAPLLKSIRVTAATSDVPYYTEITVFDPGPKWGIAVENKSGVGLNATGTNHWVRFVGIDPEIQ